MRVAQLIEVLRQLPGHAQVTTWCAGEESAVEQVVLVDMPLNKVVVLGISITGIDGELEWASDAQAELEWQEAANDIARGKREAV